ncbi:MAG: hypothetical protein M0Z83_02645 [Betaproteobacteria bacterium]|nr:hypothetical protein [Betaproteobacteria bacterium]
MLPVSEMMKLWLTWGLVVWLALMQGIAPLLHAHVHDLSVPGKIHIQGLDEAMNHLPGKSVVSQIQTYSTDDSISMESLGKNEHQINLAAVCLLVAVILLALARLPCLIRITPVYVIDALSAPPYTLPWSLAPPTLLH